MIIVNLTGGLGNQMFQYALYKAFSMRGVHVKLDTSHINSDMKNMNRCTIFDAFRLDECYTTDGRMMNVIRKRVLIPIFKRTNSVYKEQEVGRFDPCVFKFRKGYINGYWQTEKYFKEYRTEICNDFSLVGELSEKNIGMLQKIIAEPCAVSLHIRLGDYTSSINEKFFGGICTENYYKNAIEYINKKYTNAKFFVFSNEPEKIKTVLPDANYEIVNINDESTGWMDMYLMSQCKHNIIANSTFSWWGAWLNQNENKTVIAPRKWINERDMPDICPSEWIRIDEE